MSGIQRALVSVGLLAVSLAMLPQAAMSRALIPATDVLAPVEPFETPGTVVAQQDPVPPAPQAPAEGTPPTDDGGEDSGVLPNSEEVPLEDEFSVGEIPAVETVELTPETARKAIDAYVLVRDKYRDAELENYENLQDFVEQDTMGKPFEADIKTFGFPGVNDWNIAITTVGFAYSNVIDDQTTDIKQQIEEVKADTEMAQDMRDRMVLALSAMIPSDNNRKIIDELLKDPVYGERLKMLETEEE